MEGGGGLCYIFSCKYPSIINHHIDLIFDRVSSLTQSAWNQSDIDCISQRQTLPLLLTFFGPLLWYKARSRLARASLAEWDTLWSANWICFMIRYLELRGRTGDWMGYTLSLRTIQEPEINQGHIAQFKNWHRNSFDTCTLNQCRSISLYYLH